MVATTVTMVRVGNFTTLEAAVAARVDAMRAAGVQS